MYISDRNCILKQKQVSPSRSWNTKVEKESAPDGYGAFLAELDDQGLDFGLGTKLIL